MEAERTKTGGTEYADAMVNLNVNVLTIEKDTLFYFFTN